MLRRMCLRHGARAAPAGIFWTTRHQHAELCRDYVETLGDVFADYRHWTASAWTHRAAWFDHALDARQMNWQLAAVGIAGAFRATRLAFDNRLGLFLRSVQHALSDFDIFKRKIVLIRCQLFGL